MKSQARALDNMSARSIITAARNLTRFRAEQALGLGCALCHSFATSTTAAAQRQDELESSEVEAVDPFLAKLQHQTEASYLELLSRKDAVAQTEEDALEEEQIEERSKDRGEWGGPKGPEPTRFGDWEKAGRCSDF